MYNILNTQNYDFIYLFIEYPIERHSKHRIFLVELPPLMGNLFGAPASHNPMVL